MHNLSRTQIPHPAPSLPGHCTPPGAALKALTIRPYPQHPRSCPWVFAHMRAPLARPFPLPPFPSPSATLRATPGLSERGLPCLLLPGVPCAFAWLGQPPPRLHGPAQGPHPPLQMGRPRLVGTLQPTRGHVARQRQRGPEPPLVWAPSPGGPMLLWPPPLPSCRGLIQACGKRMGRGGGRGPGRPLVPLGCLPAADAAWAPASSDLRNLLNCDSPWLRGAGPGPARALSSAAAGCGEPRGGGLAGQGAHGPLDSRPSTPRPRDCGGSAAFQRC